MKITQWKQSIATTFWPLTKLVLPPETYVRDQCGMMNEITGFLNSHSPESRAEQRFHPYSQGLETFKCINIVRLFLIKC